MVGNRFTREFLREINRIAKELQYSPFNGYNDYGIEVRIHDATNWNLYFGQYGLAYLNDNCEKLVVSCDLFDKIITIPFYQFQNKDGKVQILLSDLYGNIEIREIKLGDLEKFILQYLITKED